MTDSGVKTTIRSAHTVHWAINHRRPKQRSDRSSQPHPNSGCGYIGGGRSVYSKNCIVWKKINPKPEGTTKRWSTSTEFVFFFTKSLNHRFGIDTIRVPYKHDALSNPPRHRRLNGKMQMGTADLHHPLGKVPADFIETNVASIHLDEDIEHPAMFPEELIEPFVKATTEKNDMVLDVFAGSGTTGVVALDLGRRFVGYEINRDFCKLCEHR